MDGLVEGGDVGEGLVGEVMGLKIAPDRLDFVEFGGVFRQPLDGEPVCAGGQGGERALAGVNLEGSVRSRDTDVPARSERDLIEAGLN